MTIRTPQSVPLHNARWIKSDGSPDQTFYQYINDLDKTVRLLITSMARYADNVAFADLPAGSEGDIIYVTDGRKGGEGPGLGTGVLCFKDGSAWIAVDTGAAVAA